MMQPRRQKRTGSPDVPVQAAPAGGRGRSGSTGERGYPDAFLPLDHVAVGEATGLSARTIRRICQAHPGFFPSWVLVRYPMPKERFLYRLNPARWIQHLELEEAECRDHQVARACASAASNEPGMESGVTARAEKSGNDSIPLGGSSSQATRPNQRRSNRPVASASSGACKLKKKLEAMKQAKRSGS